MRVPELLLTLISWMAPTATAIELYVANETNSGGDGTLGSPLSSVSACAALMGQNDPVSGETVTGCRLLGGEYRLPSTVELSGLHAAAGERYGNRAQPLFPPQLALFPNLILDPPS